MRAKTWGVWSAMIFFMAGVLFLFFGYSSNPDSKTQAGLSLKTFWYLTGAGFIFLAAALYGGILYVTLRANQNRQKMLAFGISGRAIILSSHTTGAELDNRPEVELEVKVRVPGWPEYGSSIRAFIDPRKLRSFQEGAEIPVLIDPNDKNRLKIDFRSRPI